MPRIFLSSPIGKSSVTRKLARDLEARGFETFVPARDFQEGADYSQITMAISQSDSFLVLVESNPKRSEAQEREWFAVLNEASDLKKGKRLIPVVLGGGEPPNFLKNWQALRLRTPGDAKQWHKLVEAISNALQSREKPKLAALSKSDLNRWNRRQESIAETARHLKSLGM